MPLCVGIDLGTTNSVIGYYNEETDSVEIIPNHIGERLTPSCVAFTEQGILVGKPALESGEVVISHVKRLIGLKQNQCILDHLEYPVEMDKDGNPIIPVKISHQDGSEPTLKYYKPEEISSHVLYYLKCCAEDYLQQKITDVVITVPAYFSEAQRRATKDACTISGMNCIRLVAEPTSACLCYGLHKKTSEKILVYDNGGGTLDVSLLNVNNGIFEVLKIDGNSQLGGADIDYILMDFLSEEYYKQTNKRIKIEQAVAEQVKKTLSSTHQTVVRLPDFKFTFTRDLYESLIEEFIEKSLMPVDNVLTDVNRREIEQIVLVGGTTRIPLLQRRLKAMFGPETNLNKSVNPDEAVAIGATIQASILKQVGSKCKDLLLLDVCPLSLGIETVGGVMSTIIKRNTQLPAEAHKMFSNVDDNQETVEIKIFQGERSFTKDCIPLGIFTLSNLPKKPRGFHKIKVSFSLNCDGLLEVSAVDKNTGLQSNISIKSESNLTDSDVKRLLEEAEKYRAHDINRKKCLEEIKNFEKSMKDLFAKINAVEYKHLLVDEISKVNQYIMSVNEWIFLNKEQVNYELMLEYREQVERWLRPYVEKIYSYKSLLDNANENYVSEEKAPEGNELIDDMLKDITAQLL